MAERPQGGALLTLPPGRGLQAASMPKWIVVNNLAWGLENGDAASTPRPGPLAVGGSVRMRPAPGFQDYWTCTLLDLISSSAIIARISEAIEPLNFVGFPFASFTSEPCATGHGCFAAKQAANIFEPAKQF